MENQYNFQDLLHEAMKAHDELKKRVLRMIMSAVKLAEINKGSKLDLNEIQAILQKEIKSRRETILDAQKAGREELIADTQAEIGYLESFLPRQLSDAELTTLVKNVMKRENISSIKEMGKLMKAVLPELEGRATSQRVSEIVKTELGKLN